MKKDLRPSDPLYREALDRFRRVMRKAATSGIPDPTAVAVATASARARPSIRMVLLKEVDERGFVFFTNYESRKGREIAENPRAAMGFYWPTIAVQVVVEGAVEPVSAAEADAYWATRPRDSQIGAWASRQSRPSRGVKDLVLVAAKLSVKFAGRPVPRPPYWSGFRVIPDRIEFWKARPFRLHERTEYKRIASRWRKRFLFP